MREFILIPSSQVAIRIQIAEGGLEHEIIMTIRMNKVFSDSTSPAHGHSMEARDDIEYFAFTTGICIRTEGKHERAGGHEV